MASPNTNLCLIIAGETGLDRNAPRSERTSGSKTIGSGGPALEGNRHSAFGMSTERLRKINAIFEEVAIDEDQVRMSRLTTQSLGSPHRR